MTTTSRPHDLRLDVEVARRGAPGAWAYAGWPDSVSTLGTRGRVRVEGTVDGEPTATSLTAPCT